MSAYVYRAEAKGIQSWILASDRLRELKGGSALIDGLAGDARSLFARVGARGTLVSAAAGAVEVHFDDVASLERFAAAWPAIVDARAPGLTLVHAWAPQEHRGEIFEKLGAARNLRAPQLPEAGPLAARSARTGLPAVHGGADGMEDRAVRAKVIAAQGRGLDSLLPPDLDFCEDAEQLGDSYMAVVHADGNGVGALFQGLDEPEARRALSQNLTDATRAAARRAVEALVRWSREDGSLLEHPRAGSGNARVRARPVVLGGDDVTFLVDAVYALAFARAFLVAFEEETQRRGVPLTACAGVAFVKTGFPFHAAHDLAESLCKAAKRGLRAGAGPATTGLLFHRVTTSSTDTDWSRIVHGELGRHGDGASWYLSGGPYDVPRLDHLAALAAAAGDLPRKALREWLTLARVDPTRAGAHWKRAREVAGATSSSWTRFASALRSLEHDPGTGWEIAPRAPSGGRTRRHTALADALVWRSLQPDDADRLRTNAPGRIP